MGTSKGYKAPTTPPWPDLKRNVSRQASDGPPSADSAQNTLHDFIAANGGPATLTSGSGGKAAQVVAGKIASFISAIEDLGLREALRQANLEDLIGKSVSEMAFALIDYLGGSANTVDEVDARNALSRFLSELLEETSNSKEVVRILEAIASRNELENLLIKFFGYFVYERFCRVFFERLTTRVGEAKAQSYLKGIFDYIKASLRNRTFGRNLSSIDWSGQEGESIIKEILNETLDVFGG